MADRNPRAWRAIAPSWLGWIGLLLALRAALVLAVCDVSFWGEELARGTAAKALIDGVPIPLHELVYNEFEGGSLISALVCVPAFLLLGQNLLAHKLVALLWLAASFAVGLALCARFLGRRAMHAFALLFVLAPGSFQKLSLLNLGSHFSALLFLLAGLYCLLALLAEPRPRAMHAAGLGLCAGLGSYFSFQNALFATFALAVLLLQRREALRGRAGLAGWIALLAGLSPLAWMFSRVGWRVFDVHGPRGEAGANLSVLERSLEFARSVLADRAGLDVAAIAALLLLVGLAAWSVRGAAAADPSRAAARVLLAYFALFAVVYVFSSYAQGEITHWFQFNRLSPLWLMATLAAAVACERAPRFAALALLALAALGGALDWQRAFGGGLAQGLRDGIARNTRFCGYTYFGFFNHLREKRALDTASEARIWLCFDEPARAWLETSATAALFHDPATGFAAGTQFVAAHAPQGWRGLGVAWMRSQSGGLSGALDAPLERRPALLEAIGRAAPQPIRMAEGLKLLREQSAPSAEQQGCLDALAFGLGYKLFEHPGETDRRYFERRESVWCLNEAAFERWCAALDASARDRERLRAGYAAARAERVDARFGRG